MSTNKSQNLNLHLWAPEDDFLRTEFNENFAAIDTAVKADRTAIAQAQNTASAARAEAAALPYVVGTYTGTGAAMTITLGFRPSFVIISGMQENQRDDGDYEYTRYNAVSGGHLVTRRLNITDSGFSVTVGTGGTYSYPILTQSGRVYDYIAFR